MTKRGLSVCHVMDLTGFFSNFESILSKKKHIVHFEIIKTEFLSISVFKTSTKKLETITKDYITTLEICDYTVCDKPINYKYRVVTNVVTLTRGYF